MRVPFAYGASAVDATYVALGYEVMAGKEYVHNEVLESCVKTLVVCDERVDFTYAVEEGIMVVGLGLT